MTAENILLNRTGQVKLGEFPKRCLLEYLLTAVRIANVCTTILLKESTELADDGTSFGRVLLRLFLPLDPDESLLKEQVGSDACDFLTCVRTGTVQHALRVRT